MSGSLLSSLDWLRRRSSVAAAVSLQHSGSLRDEGWFESVRRGTPVDRAGRPIPWISYPALRFLERRVQPQMQVFEFGSGYSTLWWAARVKKVIACESDPKWHAQLHERAPANAEIVLAPVEDYPSVIQPHGAVFDIVTIDGGDRCACAEAAPAALSSSGIILWDDSDRPEYRPGLELLRDRGFAGLEFVGLGPIVNITKETSIFYRPGNILGV